MNAIGRLLTSSWYSLLHIVASSAFDFGCISACVSFAAYSESYTIAIGVVPPSALDQSSACAIPVSSAVLFVFSSAPRYQTESASVSAGPRSSSVIPFLPSQCRTLPCRVPPDEKR